jgi:transglutaminase-like putative cysteine protease
MARLLALLPVLVAVVALGQAADDWRLAGVLGSIATLLAAVGPRFEVDRGRRLLVAAIGGGAGFAVVDVLYDHHRGSLAEGWTRFAASAILAAAARFLLVGVEGRRVTTALVFVGLLAVGETQVRGYSGFVALFVLTSAWAPVTRDEYALVAEAPTIAGASARRLVAGAAILLLGSALAAGITAGARRGYRWMTNRPRSQALNWSPQVGFSDQIDLGGIDELLDSDTVVLRVRGPRVDYLRGAVLDFYASGRWLRSDATETETVGSYGSAPTSDDAVKIAAVSDRTDRFFLPLAARFVATTPASVRVDPTGSIKRNGDYGVESATFAIGPRDRAVPSPPDASDLQIPRAARERVKELAQEWAGDATTPAAKLDAFERHFQIEFRYERSFATLDGPDPVLDFLFGRRSGHCEYFATAMVLLARASGIPARFVAGYRVGERTPFGYYMVRERNAHAWVEVWMPGEGWMTRDPTPESYLPQNREHRSSYLASLSDGLRVGYDALDDWLQRRTLEQTAVAWGVGFAVLVWIVARGVRRRGTLRAGPSDDHVGLHCLEVLLATLERSGIDREGHEPIERLAARTPDRDAARLLQRYAALRYGGIGDADALARDVAAYARSNRKGPEETAP